MGAKESLAEFRKDSSMERDQMGQIQELITVLSEKVFQRMSTKLTEMLK